MVMSTACFGPSSLSRKTAASRARRRFPDEYVVLVETAVNENTDLVAGTVTTEPDEDSDQDR